MSAHSVGNVCGRLKQPFSDECDRFHSSFLGGDRRPYGAGLGPLGVALNVEVVIQ